VKITEATLQPEGAPIWRYACQHLVDAFLALYPKGAEPTVEVLTALQAAGLDVWWLIRLLPLHGANGVVAFALFCADPNGTHPQLESARQWVAGSNVGGNVPEADLRASAAEAWAVAAWTKEVVEEAAEAAEAAANPKGVAVGTQDAAQHSARLITWLSAALLNTTEEQAIG